MKRLNEKEDALRKVNGSRETLVNIGKFRGRAVELEP